MIRLSRFHRAASWLAMFAILLAALAPTVSQAMNRTNGENIGWVEVCTTYGIVLLSPGEAPDGSDGVPTHGSASGHCPFCCTHGGSFGLPVSAAPGSVFSIGVHERPLFRPLAVRLASTWPRAYSRAPPSYS